MTLSTRSRYGVRMMYEPAINYGKSPVIIRDIASRRDMVSVRFPGWARTTAYDPGPINRKGIPR